jgi:hypothetical protein
MALNQYGLDADEIRRLLGLLDEELAAAGEAAVLYVVGGANMALSLNARRTTTDIDVVIKRGSAAVLAAAQAVAARVDGLGEDWLNNAFTGYTDTGGMTWSWFDNRDDDQPSTAYSGQALFVELASPAMMLALKTLAARDQDMDDIYLLMRHLGIRTPLELGRNLARFTGRRIFDAQRDPYMYLHIDPEFHDIFDNAPDDLRPPAQRRGRPGGRRTP